MLYPVPKVIDGVEMDVIVARAGRYEFVVAPVRAVVAVRVATELAAREIVSLCLLRSVVVFRMAVRDGVVLRETIFCFVERDAVSSPYVFCVRTVVFFVGWRVRKLSSRTAALATPTPTNIAIMQINAFLILSTINIMIAKNVVSDKENELKKYVKKIRKRGF